MEVYSMAINTMLLSFCLDEQKFLAGGRTPPARRARDNLQGVPLGRGSWKRVL
jgi:hypothetical protein